MTFNGALCLAFCLVHFHCCSSYLLAAFPPRPAAVSDVLAYPHTDLVVVVVVVVVGVVRVYKF